MVLNAAAAQAAPSPDAARSRAPSPDPQGVVAVARDPDGTVRLKQRDGSVREIAPDGKMTLRSGDAAAPLQGDLPPSVIVAVDTSNTVHMVDPDACMARKVSTDGRVATTLLPAAPAGRPCGAVPR